MLSVEGHVAWHYGVSPVEGAVCFCRTERVCVLIVRFASLGEYCGPSCDV